MYDDLIVDAPFWPEPLLEVDMTPFPKSAVSALAGFHLGDEIQMIEGLGTLGAESPETCAQVSSVAAAIASMGVAACQLFTDPSARTQCSGLVAGAGAGATGIIHGAMGCGSTPTVRASGETEAQMRQRLELEARIRQQQQQQQRTQNMLLIGGGVAAAAALAYIALRR